jgi:hypothetical protein
MEPQGAAGSRYFAVSRTATFIDLMALFRSYSTSNVMLGLIIGFYNVLL